MFQTLYGSYDEEGTLLEKNSSRVMAIPFQTLSLRKAVLYAITYNNILLLNISALNFECHLQLLTGQEELYTLLYTFLVSGF